MKDAEVRLSFSLALIIAAMALMVAAGCNGSGSDDADTALSGKDKQQAALEDRDLIGQTKPVRLTIGYNIFHDGDAWGTRDSTLTIWKDFEKPIGFIPLSFPYNDRGPGVKGTMTYIGDGKAELFFPEENITPESVPPLHMVSVLPDIPVQVDIKSKDLIGYVDFKTGEVRLSFDARFVPSVFGYEYPEMSVVTDLYTGVSRTKIAPEKEYAGRVLNARGDLRLAGVAQIPKAVSAEKPLDAEFVNALLSLPTDAVTEMEAHLDFPEGRFPGSPTPATGEMGVFMKVGKDAELSISTFPTFGYDGFGSYGIGTYTLSDDGKKALVEFSEFNVPNLDLIPGWIRFLSEVPGLGFVRIEIETHSLGGSVDLETGQIDLAFDATFNPVVFEIPFPGVAVVTNVTTETSKGLKHSATGERLDGWGDAVLAGVAVVPKLEPVSGEGLTIQQEKEFENFLLSLPTDAVCVLPVHLDFVGLPGN